MLATSWWMSSEWWLYNQRQKLHPTLPTTAADIDLNGEWTETTTREPFLLADTNTYGRLLVFGTQDYPDPLSSSWHSFRLWYLRHVSNRLPSVIHTACHGTHSYTASYQWKTNRSTPDYSLCYKSFVNNAIIHSDPRPCLRLRRSHQKRSINIKGCFFSIILNVSGKTHRGMVYR